jgi:hypothetical protein
MKNYRLTFTEEQWTQFENLIGELPTKFGVPLLNMINPNLQVAEDKPKDQVRPVEMPVENVYSEQS